MSIVETRFIKGNIGYIKLWGEFDFDFNGERKPPQHWVCSEGLSRIQKAKVRGL